MKPIYNTTILIFFLILSLKTDAQVLGVSECFSENDAFIGLDRKAWTTQESDLSESYQIDFTIPEDPPFDCYEIDYVDISIDLSVNQNNIIAECFLGYWTHVLNCEDHDPIGCPTNDIFFDMQGLRNRIILTEDLFNGTTLGIDVVVLTVATNSNCSQTPITDGDFDADLEICVDVYYVPKEIDEEIDLGDDITICPGETIDLEGPDGFEEYVWEGPIDSDEQNLENAVAGEYTLEVYDSEGCRISDDIVILEEDSFLVELSSPAPLALCEGNSLSLTALVDGLEANPGFSYDWFRGQTLLSSNPAYNFTQQGNYSLLVASNATDCEQRLDFTIGSTLLSPAQIDSISLDTVRVCVDSLLQLNAFIPSTDTNTYFFEWITATDTLVQDSLLVSSTGLYILNQSNTLGCPESSDSIFIEYLDGVNAGSDSNISLCQGGDFMLSNLISSSADPDGTWESSPDLAGLSTGIIQTADITPGLYTLFYIVPAVPPCLPDTSMHELTILNAQLDAGDDSDAQLCPGEEIDIEQLINGDTDGIYYNDSFSALNSVLVSANDLDEGENVFYYVVESAQCSNDTAQITLTLLPDPGISLVQGPICLTDSLVIEGQVFSAANPSGMLSLSSVSGCDSIIDVDLQFFPEASGDLAVELCDGESFTFQGQSFNEAMPEGSVVLNGVSQNGCDSIVNVSLSFTSILTETLSATLCENEELNVNGTVYNLNNPTGTQSLTSTNGCDSLLTVELNFLEQTDSLLQLELCRGESLMINNETIDNTTTQLTQILTNSAGCDSILTVEATILENSESFIMENLCAGESLNVEGEVFDEGNTSGQVLLENSNQFGCDSIINVELEFNEIDEVQFNVELCEGDSIEVDGVWVSDAGNYESLFQNQAGCDSLVTTLVELVNCQVAITIDIISQLDCFGGDGSEIIIQFNDNALGLSYRLVDEDGNIVSSTANIVSTSALVFTDLSAGNYEFIIDDNGIVVNNVFFEVTQPEALVHNSQIEDVACPGDMSGAIILEISGGTAPYSVNWSTGQTGTELSQLAVGMYNYTITDSMGCQAFGNTEITQPENLDLEMVLQDATCDEASDGQASIQNITGGIAPYRFSIGGSGFQSSNSFDMLAAGNYTLLVNDGNNCEYQFPFTIAVADNLELSVPANITITEGEQALINASINFNASSISWSNPAILSCSDCLNPTLTASQSTSLNLSVTDENGCVLNATIEITVLPNLNNEIYIPNIIQVNAFSAANDRFVPYISEESSIQFTALRIFDRWGNMVYSESGVVNGWDGRYNNQDVIPGVYVYQLEYLQNGEERITQGQLTVIR